MYLFVYLIVAKGRRIMSFIDPDRLQSITSSNIDNCHTVVGP